MRFNYSLGKIFLLAVLALACSKSNPVVPVVPVAAVVPVVAVAPVVSLFGCYLASTSETSRVVTLTYNSTNQITQLAVEGDPFSTVTFSYDSKGNISSIVSVNGGTKVFTYDANNLLVSVSNGLSFQYNSSGQVISVTTGSNTFTYTYPNTTTRNYVSKTSGAITSTYEYDTKNTPTKSIKGLQCLYSLIPISPSLNESLPTENNITKWTLVYNGTTSIMNYTYQYNDKGYPTTQTGTEGTNTPTIVTYTYECK